MPEGRLTFHFLIDGRFRLFLAAPVRIMPLAGRGEHYTSLPANTKHLYNICTMLDQRRRRWSDVVQMLYKCFVFAGSSNEGKPTGSVCRYPATHVKLPCSLGDLRERLQCPKRRTLFLWDLTTYLW